MHELTHLELNLVDHRGTVLYLTGNRLAEFKKRGFFLSRCAAAGPKMVLRLGWQRSRQSQKYVESQSSHDHPFHRRFHRAHRQSMKKEHDTAKQKRRAVGPLSFC